MTSVDDIVSIRSLYDRYNHGIDTGDGAMFAGCFTEDGSLNTLGEPMVGHAVGDTANAVAFFVGYVIDPAYAVIVTGRYEDEFRRTADGWRIASRVFTPDVAG